MTSRERAPVISNWNGKRKRQEKTGIKREETGVVGEVETKDLAETPGLIQETNPNRKEEAWKDKDSSDARLSAYMSGAIRFSGQPGLARLKWHVICSTIYHIPQMGSFDGENRCNVSTVDACCNRTSLSRTLERNWKIASESSEDDLLLECMT